MSVNPKLPLTVFLGTEGAIRMVSRSHGVSRPNMIEDVTVTPKVTLKMIEEYDNLLPVLNYSTYDGVTGSLKYNKSNQQIIESILMDTDPSLNQVMLDQASMSNFTFFSNRKGLDGNIKGSFLSFPCTPGANPSTGPLKTEATSTLPFDAIVFQEYMGLALQYTRIRGTGVQVAPPAAATLATATTGGFLPAGDYYVQITSVTAGGETTVSSETGITIPSGTSTNDITVTTPSSSGSVTSHNIYLSNVSNGEQYAANDAGSTSTVLTTLPAASAVTVPRFNTSGIFAAPGDLVFSSSAATFPIPAYFFAQTGLPYVCVMKNGNVIATTLNPGSNTDFIISADGTTFTVNDTNTYNWYDVFTLYVPLR